MKKIQNEKADFKPSMANFVTYVEAGTTCFKDVPYDFDGSALVGKEKYYKITAVDRNLNESLATQEVMVKTK